MTKKAFLTILILTCVLPSLAFGKSASSTEEQSLIAQLQEQIKALQTQVEALTKQIETQNKAIETQTKEIETVKTELAFTKTLQRGMTGDDVKKLQEFLKQFPDIYPEGLVTGYYGAKTEAAIKKLQEKQGLEQVGAVGPKTLTKLNELVTQGAGQSGVIPPAFAPPPPMATDGHGEATAGKPGLLTAPGLEGRISSSSFSTSTTLLPTSTATMYIATSASSTATSTTAATVPITVTYPNGGETIPYDRNYHIGSRLYMSGRVGYKILKGSQVVYQISSPSMAGIPGAGADLPFPSSSAASSIGSGSDYKVRVFDWDNPAVYDDSDNYFSVAPVDTSTSGGGTPSPTPTPPPTTPPPPPSPASSSPSVTIIYPSPGGGETFSYDTRYEIRYSSAGVSRVGFQLVKANTTVVYGTSSPTAVGSPLYLSLSGAALSSSVGSGTDYRMVVYDWDHPGTNGTTLIAGVSGYFTILPAVVADTTPPSAITDFSIPTTYDNSVVLSWSAPGDDGSVGTATNYVLKYSTAGAINESNWSSATLFTGSTGSPLPAGTSQGTAVFGLTPATSYWFAIKAFDEAGNYSLSNSPMATTKGIAGTSASPNITVEYYQGIPVHVSWTSPPGTTYFLLYRYNWRTGDSKTITISSSATVSYTDTDVVPGGKYMYKIQACNASGCSGDSANQTTEVTGGASGSITSKNNLASVLEVLQSLAVLLRQIQQSIGR